MRSGTIFTIAVFIALFAPNCTQAGTLYSLASANPAAVYTIDPATGVATLVRTMVRFSNLNDIDFLNGTLYGVNIWSGSVYSFGTVDLNTGTFTPLNSQSGSSWTGLAAVPLENKFYAINYDTNNLVTITPGGVSSVIGFGLPYIVDLAYDSNHDILYGTSNTTLYAVNRVNGATTTIGSITAASNNTTALGLGYDIATNTLYLNNGESHQFYRVSTVNATVTAIGSNGTTVILDSLAVLQSSGGSGTGAPEPTSWLLLVSGILLLAGRGSRLVRRSSGLPSEEALCKSEAVNAV
jgi:hypothetical protein